MMMIRINLLPVRQVKKRELGRQVLVLAGVVLVLTGVLNFIWYDRRSSELSRRETQVADTKRRVTELEKVIGEVNNIKSRKKEVEDKLKILNDLRRGRAGPVRMMDALATATPQKVWLSDFVEQAGQVKISGSAVSHDDVAEFMRGLRSVVWTPKGMGRLVEQKRDSKTTRVELIGGGAIEDFPAGEIGTFFTNIDLKSAQAQGGGTAVAARLVRFEISLNANYAI